MCERSLAPLHCLSADSRDVLAALNRPTVIPTERDALARDWRGLLDLAIVPERRDLTEQLNRSPTPTSLLLSAWQRLDLERANVRLLCEHLERLDRFDVLDDVTPHLERDVARYMAGNATPSCRAITPVGDEQLTNYITRLDAFILYAPADVQFVYDIKRNMEAKGFKFSTVVDLFPDNIYDHLSVREFIEKRCEALIVILSPQFNLSQFNMDCLNYIHGVSLQNNKIKLIPLMYQTYTDIPNALNFKTIRDYTKLPPKRFWDILAASLNSSRSAYLHTSRTNSVAPSTSYNNISAITMTSASQSYHSNLVQNENFNSAASETCKTSISTHLEENALNNNNSCVSSDLSPSDMLQNNIQNEELQFPIGLNQPEVKTKKKSKMKSLKKFFTKNVSLRISNGTNNTNNNEGSLNEPSQDNNMKS